MPEITGRLEITLSVRDPARSAAWYSQLLGMHQTYDHTSDDGRMRYICLVEPRSELVLCLVGHAANPGEEFSELRTGLDHLELVVERRDHLVEWVHRLGEMGVEHSGVKELDYTPNAPAHLPRPRQHPARVLLACTAGTRRLTASGHGDACRTARIGRDGGGFR